MNIFRQEPTAKWIWLDYPTPNSLHSQFHQHEITPLLAEEKNRWGLFRKTFQLQENFDRSTAKLYITADSRYQLFINGQYVGRGIYRCNRHQWYYDEFDVGKFLVPGKNVIAIIAQFFGENMSWYQGFPRGGITSDFLGKGFVLFKLTVQPKDPSLENIVVVSDETVKAAECHAWAHTLKRPWIGLPFLEIFDANQMPSDWFEREFDDSSPLWSHVRDLKIENHWPELIHCDIPRLEENFIRAPAVVSAGPFNLYFSDEEIEESLQEEEERIDFFMQMGLSSYQNQTPVIIEEWREGKEIVLSHLNNPFDIVFDMGQEQTGFIDFCLDTDQQGLRIDILWSEELDSNRENLLPKCNIHEFKYGSQYIAKKGENTHQMFHWHGFRYVQLLIQPPVGEKQIKNVKIKQFGVTLYHYPLLEQAKFHCNDERLNRLFEICKWTMRCCMHDGYEDCPSREQRQWVGDAYVEVLVNLAVFGDVPLAKKLIRQTMESQLPNGLVEMTTPGDHEIHGLFIPDYTLYWILTVYELYRYTGDLTLLDQYLPSIIKATDWFVGYVNGFGLVTDLPYWIFIDWSINDKWGANSTINAQLIYTLEKMIEMAQIAEYPSIVKKYRPIREKMMVGFNQYFWNAQRGAYCDAVKVDDSGNLQMTSRKFTMHANALAILYDIAPLDRQSQIVQNIFRIPFDQYFVQNHEPIWKGITASKYDEDRHVILAQPFFMFHVHQALAKVGEYQRMFEFIEKGWVTMAELGATTIWEHWGDSGSRCHAWSTTPAYDFIRHILGIQLCKPGGSKISISPQMMGLTNASGVVPTQNGMLEVEWRYDNHNNMLEISHTELPNIKIEVKPPRLNGSTPKIVETKRNRNKFTIIFQYS